VSIRVENKAQGLLKDPGCWGAETTDWRDKSRSRGSEVLKD